MSALPSFPCTDGKLKLQVQAECLFREWMSTQPAPIRQLVGTEDPEISQPVQAKESHAPGRGLGKLHQAVGL